MINIRHVAHLGINDRGQLCYRSRAGNLPSKAGRAILSNRIITSEGSTYTDYDDSVHNIQPSDSLQFEDGVWKLIRSRDGDEAERNR